MDAVQRALDNFAQQPRETELRLQRQAMAVRSLYSAEQERSTIAQAWHRIAIDFQAWRESLQA